MKEWPINPRFISLRESATEETAELNRDGIFYPDYIRGFLGDSSLDVNIENPLTLFQFVPNDFTAINFNKAIKEIDSNWIEPKLCKYLGNRKLIRIDTDNLCRNRDCCDCYREQGPEQLAFCQKQDSRVALLASSELDEFDVDKVKDFEAYYTKLDEIISIYNKETIINEMFNIKIGVYKYKEKKRLYLSYICRESYLKEYLFPVYSCGRIIACLVQGQIIYKELDKKKMFRRFLNNHHCPQLDQYISRIEIPTGIDWENAFRQRIRAIYNRINFLEERINERIKVRTLNYISKSFTNIKNNFSTEFDKLSLEDEDLFDNFHQILDATLNSVCHDFDNYFGFIRIFAIPFQIQSDDFKLIGSSNEIAPDNYKKFFFSISEEDRLEIMGKSPVYTKLLDEKASESLLKTASSMIKQEYQKSDIFRIVSTISPKVYFIIWKRYPKWENNIWYDNYRDALFSLYNLIFQSYSFARGAFSEKMLENSIRISNHEAGQIVPAIAGSIRVDFINKSAIALTESIRSGVFYKKMENFYTQLYLLDGIYQRPSFIFKEVKISPTWIDLFDAVKKMCSLFMLQTRDKYMKINCDPKYLENVDIYVERKFFDHVLYNLIENAVKYGYEGSNINIYAFHTNNDFRIQIVSFGPQINNKDKIYDLFVRGASEVVKAVEGMGIGMFISKKLCKIHDGDLEHSSNLIFPSHLPAIYSLKELGKNKVDISEYFDKLIQKLDNVQNISEVVNLSSNFTVGRNKLEAVKNLATCKNSFTIILPIDSVKTHLNNQF